MKLYILDTHNAVYCHMVDVLAVLNCDDTTLAVRVLSDNALVPT